MTNKSGGDETINARRRRQGASSGPQGSERAEMPPRQRQGSSSGGGGGSYRPTGSSGGGGTGPKLPLWLIILIAIGFVLYSLFSSNGTGSETGSDFPDDQNNTAEEPADLPGLAAQPTRTPVPTRPAGQAAQGSTSGQKWTVMLYMDADDQILEQDIYMDLNEVERVGSSERVQIVSQMDRYKGAYNGDGNWTTTRRYHITQDDDLQTVNSELVEDLGEVNMADGDTLVDFITWAASAYPADKYVLILSDHGMGWPGGFSDGSPAAQDASRAPLVSALEDDQLYLMEIGQSLAEAVQQAGIDKLELVGMDACLMGHIEVLSALEPYARYAVVSQETEPSLGWAYTSFLQGLVEDPDMNGAGLGELIIGSYIKDDQRINDPEARAEFLRQGSPMGGLFGSTTQVSAASLAQQLGKDITLTSVDLAQVPALVTSLNNLAYTLQSEDQEIIATARTHAPSFTNIFGEKTRSPYIDLGGFAQMLKRAGANAGTGQAADELLSAIQNAVIAETHGSGKAGSTGISIYFPNSTLYRSPVTGPQSYTAIARRFAEESLWDDFLVFYFNDVSFNLEPQAPDTSRSGEISRVPGQGEITASPITLSEKTASPNNPVTLTTNISGNNIGYIYLFVGYFDQSTNAIFKADTDYLESSNTQELNGVYYPVWSENASFNLSFEWEPTLFQITDGENTSVALFNPQTYGASAEEAVYTVDGIYHYADGESRSARLYFRDGVLRQVFGFTDENQTGGAREIIPQAGDTFTIYENWLDLDSSGQVTQSSTQEGALLTFGSQPFTWKEVYAAAGDYVVGFIIQDLDGNSQEVYTTVTVQ